MKYKNLDRILMILILLCVLYIGIMLTLNSGNQIVYRKPCRNIIPLDTTASDGSSGRTRVIRFAPASDTILITDMTKDKNCACALESLYDLYIYIDSTRGSDSSGPSKGGGPRYTIVQIVPPLQPQTDEK